MKILTLTNLFPPHHAGTNDFRCENIVGALRLRGHQILVLTSMHGMHVEQRDENVERRLWLNGVYGETSVTAYNKIKELELHNHGVLSETIEQFQPDVVHVFSLHGLSKSLIFGLRNAKRPTVYDVADHWISAGIREDAWLRFWNAPSPGFLDQSTRTALELSGERGRLDSQAPTRMAKGYDRLPQLFGKPSDIAAVEPGSIPSFRFDRIYFCSQALKDLSERAGFAVRHADVIYPGVAAQQFFGEIKPASAPMQKLLIVAPLAEESGIMTALQALRRLRDFKIKVNLSIYGRGDNKHVAELRSLVVREQLPVEFVNISNLNRDLPGIYRRHDVFLYTAEWADPFPITPLEAMACGLPVIGAVSGGAGELFRHGENAFTYTPGDAVELAARIQELQMQPALRAQVAENGRDEVLSKYNESTVMDQIENYLNTSQEIWSHTAT